MSESVKSIAVIYGGTRDEGNTEMLAEQAVAGLAVERIFLRDYRIRAIEDRRHAPGGFREVDDDYNAIIDRVLPHDVLVFATPIYWYGMTGVMKNFVDRWSQTLRDADRPEFRGRMRAKTAYVIAVGGDEPRLKGLPLVKQFQHIFEFFGMKYGGYILGEANQPGEIAGDKIACYQAQRLRAELHER